MEHNKNTSWITVEKSTVPYMERCNFPGEIEPLQLHDRVTVEDIYHDIALDEYNRRLSKKYDLFYWKGYDADPKDNHLPYVCPTKPVYDYKRKRFPKQGVYVGLRIGFFEELWDRPTAVRWRDELFTGLGAQLAYVDPTGSWVLLILYMTIGECKTLQGVYDKMFIVQEWCRETIERRSRLRAQRWGVPLCVNWEPVLPIFHDPDAKYAEHPAWD
jgi:hypothetical protein